MFKRKIVTLAPVVKVKTKLAMPKPIPVVIAPIVMVKIRYLGGSPLPFKAYETTFNPIGEVPKDIADMLLQNTRKWKKV